MTGDASGGVKRGLAAACMLLLVACGSGGQTPSVLSGSTTATPVIGCYGGLPQVQCQPMAKAALDATMGSGRRAVHVWVDTGLLCPVDLSCLFDPLANFPYPQPPEGGTWVGNAEIAFAATSEHAGVQIARIGVGYVGYLLGYRTPSAGWCAPGACGSMASTPPLPAAATVPATALAAIRPSSQYSAPPATPFPTAQAKCETASPEPPYYTLLGWRDGQVVLLQTTFVACAPDSVVIALDPSTDEQRVLTNVPGVAEGGTSDGRSIAVVFADSDDVMRVLVLDAADRTHIVMPPAGAIAAPVALPAGGYLLAGSRRLVLLSSEGTIVTNTSLPSGYDTLAPTSDTDRYLLALRSDAERAFGPGPTAPLHLVEWNRSTGSLSPMIAIRVEPASNALTHLFTAAPTTGSSWTIHGSWWAVQPSGRLSFVSTAVGYWSTLSSDGSRLLVVTRVGSNAVTDTVSETALPAGTTLAGYAAPTGVQADTAAWDGERVAVLLQSQLPRTGPPEVLVLDGADVTHVPLP